MCVRKKDMERERERDKTTSSATPRWSLTHWCYFQEGGDNLFLSVISAANCHHYPTSDTETSLGFRLQASQYLKLESSRFSTVFFLSASYLSFLLFILLSGRVASHPPLSYYSLPSHGKYSPMPDAQGNVL